MQPKPEWYGDDFTVNDGHCNGIQVNGIHTYSGNLSTMFSQSNQDHISCHGNEIL